MNQEANELRARINEEVDILLDFTLGTSRNVVFRFLFDVDVQLPFRAFVGLYLRFIDLSDEDVAWPDILGRAFNILTNRFTADADASQPLTEDSDPETHHVFFVVGVIRYQMAHRPTILSEMLLNSRIRCACTILKILKLSYGLAQVTHPEDLQIWLDNQEWDVDEME